MTLTGIGQILFYLFILLLCVKPLGWYMAKVYRGKYIGLKFLLHPLEKWIYRFCNIRPHQEMHWQQYLFAFLFFNLFGLLLVYALQRLQFYLPLNPQAFPNVPPDLAFNTAASFITNTDWQAYSGESTLSYFTQTTALTVQNFLSAASGMALLIAFIRGITRQNTKDIGNFWVDTIRGILYILLPLALAFSIILTSQGVIQNYKPYEKIHLLQPTTQTEQIIPMGPAASQIAIKQLGTNGGGFFAANSAHPFENPTSTTNFLEMLALLLIPAALCYTYGALVKDKRQGWAILLAMLLIFIPCAGLDYYAEQSKNPQLTSLNLHTNKNMEGKEIRIGVANSSLWATATTASSNGSVNAMLDSFTPLGGLIPLILLHLGGAIFGGVGSGLYQMLLMIIITVFVAGLMVGRTPEYLGKKIEPFEMKMACCAVLITPFIVLLLTAITTLTTSITGTHGFTQILYTFSSMVNNNGSSLQGLDVNTPFYNVLGGIAMLIGRFWIAIPILAIAGSLSQKKNIPATSGTLPTHTLLFILLLISIIIALGALTFFPALALGPIVEHLLFWGNNAHQ
ncbi:ATPase [Gammaproteobacteria bacterium SCGC AG-212-F23]|nr:ATPase [Gammaproteobacteria bacterium SCGC AG-212-F23]